MIPARNTENVRHLGKQSCRVRLHSSPAMLKVRPGENLILHCNLVQKTFRVPALFYFDHISLYKVYKKNKTRFCTSKTASQLDLITENKCTRRLKMKAYPVHIFFGDLASCTIARLASHHIPT
ncbi:hypothetical protein RvY_07841 [Ramazzottius varieornatus]|uniref:Uncharacterized protein n=1 Tax=Ramazzottius varieornatus TaxID=947166 RepID=A0A1D1V3M9_RAMVA|nr:hypothetical protein RvY_07841 [Ramazzottius varieornatus]